MQINGPQQPPFRIIFSKIKCKIKIVDTALYALVVRFGKCSSRYTAKKQLKNESLQFQDELQLPCDQKYFSNQSSKKEKSELMLYKFRSNGEKQSKQLIGMASVPITSQMFDGQNKKLRLTNSFDKQAYIQCSFKIELGWADTILQNESILSSLLGKSMDPSFSDAQQPRPRIPSVQSAISNQPKICLITSNSLNQGEYKSVPQTNKPENLLLNFFASNPSINNNLQGGSNRQIFNNGKLNDSKTEPSSVSLIRSNRFTGQQNKSLAVVCNDLKDQNNFLFDRIKNLQKNILKEKDAEQVFVQQIYNSNINSSKDLSNSRRSPMIKKNLKVDVTSAFSKIPQIHAEQHSKEKDPRLSLQKPKNEKQHLYILGRPSFRNEIVRQEEFEHSPYFAKRGPSFKDGQNRHLGNENLEVYSHLTFAGDVEQSTAKFSKLRITPLINVVYTPPLQPNNYNTSNFQRDHSVGNNRSVSDVERKSSRNYSKFQGKKTYQAIGTIKSPSQSQDNISYFQNQNQSQNMKGGSFISKKARDNLMFQSKKDSPYQQMKLSMPSPKNPKDQKYFLDFLLQNEEEKPQKQMIKGQSLKEIDINKRSYKILETKGSNLKERMTLEQLDTKTQQKFRKNQRSLKIANMKVLEQNRLLKKERKLLQQQIQQKKQLTHQQFGKLRQQIASLNAKIQRDKHAKLQTQSKFEQLNKKISVLQAQNIKLKKDLKDQKGKYQYYFKMSNLNDDRQKQRQLSSSTDLAAILKKKEAMKQTLALNMKLSSDQNLPHEQTSRSKVNLDKVPLMASITLQRKKTEQNSSIQKHLPQESAKKTSQPRMQRKNTSKAIIQLNKNLKPNIPKPAINGHSPTNQSFTGVGGSGIAAFFGGFSGTGETIVRDYSKHVNITHK